MEKGKAIPVICIIVLIVIIAYIIVSNSIVNHIVKFEHFGYETNQERINKDDIDINDILVINNVTFMVVGVEGNKVILNASEKVIDTDSSEIEIDLGDNKKVCFNENNCITFFLA